MLIQEKANVVRLRTLLEKETDPLVKNFIQYRLGTARLLHDIAECGVLKPERIEQVKTKARRRVKKAVAVISFTIIAIILAILLFAGCHTVNGVGRDLSAWSSPYIEHQEK